MTVLTTGYPSIDHIVRVSHTPNVGETARLFAVPDTYTFGGCGANIAVALAKLGLEAGIAMVLGSDEYADEYLRYLTQQGISTVNCTRLPGQQTSHSYIFMNQEGQYQNFFFPGAADAWHGHLALQNLADCRFAVVTVGQFDYNVQFIQRVAEENIPLVWVTKPDVFAYPTQMIGTFLAHSRYVMMNHIEAEYVLAALERSDVSELLNDTTQAIVVTRGAEGVLVHTGSQLHEVRAVAPPNVVDSTGAGDGFAAGFLAGLLRGASSLISAQLGVVVSSFVLEKVGCQTNLPTWEQALTRYATAFGRFEGAV